MLPVGARLALYTDGLVERRDRPIDDGIDLLAGELGRPRRPDRRRSPPTLVGVLVPGTSDDDIAVLVACVREEAEELTAALPVRPGARRGAGGAGLRQRAARRRGTRPRR